MNSHAWFPAWVLAYNAIFAILAQTPSHVEEMTQTFESKGESLSAARMTLVALRGAFRAEADVAKSTIHLRGSELTFDFEGAAQVLAVAKKPLSCEAQLREGVLVIDCAQRTDSNQVFLHAHRVELMEAGNGPIGKAIRLSKESGIPVTVRAADWAVDVSYGVLERWQRDYFIAAPVWMQGPDGVPSRDITAKVSYEITFGPTELIGPEEIDRHMPPELRERLEGDQR